MISRQHLRLLYKFAHSCYPSGVHIRDGFAAGVKVHSSIGNYIATMTTTHDASVINSCAAAPGVRWYAATTKPQREASDFQIGQVVEAKVLKKIKSGVIVDIGAERNAILDAGEVRDGFPTQGMPPVGKKLQTRVLNLDGGEVRVTCRTGDLSRPPKKRIECGDYDFSKLEDANPQQWFDGTVFSISRWGVFVQVHDMSGSGKILGLGLVRVKEFSERFVDECVEGGKIRVRILAVEPGAGRIQLTMREISQSS